MTTFEKQLKKSSAAISGYLVLLAGFGLGERGGGMSGSEGPPGGANVSSRNLACKVVLTDTCYSLFIPSGVASLPSSLGCFYNLQEHPKGCLAVSLSS